MSITYEMMKKLQAVKFRFKEFENLDEKCYIGERYFYKNNEYTIGGISDETPVTEFDIEVLKNGTWLPTTDELMLWLQTKNISLSIKYSADDMYFYSEAVTKDGNVINASGADLQMCIYKAVYKIARCLNG